MHAALRTAGERLFGGRHTNDKINHSRRSCGASQKNKGKLETRPRQTVAPLQCDSCHRAKDNAGGRRTTNHKKKMLRCRNLKSLSGPGA